MTKKYIKIPMGLVEAAIVNEDKEAAGMLLREFCLIVCGVQRESYFTDPFYEAALKFALEEIRETESK